MTILADTIMASDRHRRLLAVPGHPDGPDAGPFATIPVVIADAAAEYFFAGTPREDWEFGRDFPDCTPPATPMFVEMARPSRTISGVHGINDTSHLPERWGWRFEATTIAQLVALLSDPGRGPALVHYHRRFADKLAGSGRVDVAAVDAALGSPDPLEAARRLGGPDAGYFAAATIVRVLDDLKAGAGRDGLGSLLHGSLTLKCNGRVLGPVASLDVLLDDAGRPMPSPLINVHGGELTAVETAVLQVTILPLTFPALLALSFANSEGVTLREVEPAADLVRRHQDQGLPAPVPRLVMEIDAVAAVDRN